MALGARVRSLRRERGWTLKQLGREAGLSHPFLSQLERGLARPSVGSVERISRALGVPVGLLWSAPARGGRAALVRSDCGEHEDHDDASAPGGLRTLAGAPIAVREWTGGSRRWPATREVAAGDVLASTCAARRPRASDLDGGSTRSRRATPFAAVGRCSVTRAGAISAGWAPSTPPEQDYGPRFAVAARIAGPLPPATAAAVQDAPHPGEPPRCSA